MSDRFALGMVCLTAAILAGSAVRADGQLPDSAQFLVNTKQLAGLASQENGENRRVFDLARSMFPGVVFVPPARGPAIAQDVSTEEVKLGSLPVALLLSQLRSQVDDGVIAAIKMAQPTETANAAFLESGRLTLTELASKLEADGPAGSVTRRGREITFHVPLVVWQRAALQLEPGDQLVLDRSSGALLLNAGRLYVSGASISRAGEVNRRVPSFNGLILVTLSGSADLVSSEFRGLGVDTGKVSVGVLLAQGRVALSKAPSHVLGNRFIGTGSLALSGVQRTEIQGNRFIAARGPAILIDGGDEVVVADNVIAASPVSHGIKITAGANDVQLAGNVITGNKGDGILINGGSTNILVERNVIAHNDAAAISLSTSGCVKVADNALVANKQKAVSATRSFSVAVVRNLIRANSGAAVALQSQPEASVTAVEGNSIIDNKIGVSGTQSALVQLTRNNLNRQSPRLLAGELVQHSRRLLNAMASGADDLSLTSSAIPRDGVLASFSPANLSRCLSKESQ